MQDMQVSRWILGFSAVAAVAAGAFAGGCSSSSSPPPAPPADAAPDVEAQEASCSVDADLTAFAMSDASAAGCAACVKDMCGTDISSCASDCTCISLFSCLADAGVAASGVGVGSIAALGQCVPGGFGNLTSLESNAAIRGIFTCFGVTCADECAPATDAGPTEAGPTEAGPSPEASTPDGGDAGTKADGGDAAAP
jgi:hypothetical protein